MAMWGMGVMVGPILGPDARRLADRIYNWRWVFYINLPVGVLTFLGLSAYLCRDQDTQARASTGSASRSLEPRHRLVPDDARPRRAARLVLFGRDRDRGGARGARALPLPRPHLHAEQPFIDPRMFQDRNFTVGIIFIFMVGIILLATLALLTPYLQNLMGYPVITAGLVLAPRGIGTMVAMMIVGRMINRVDPRVLLVFGSLLTAFVLWQMAGFTPDVSAGTLIRPASSRARPRLHLRAALDHHLRDARAGTAHAGHGAVQPDAQPRLEHRHLARDLPADAATPRSCTPSSPATSRLSTTRSSASRPSRFLEPRDDAGPRRRSTARSPGRRPSSPIPTTSS